MTELLIRNVEPATIKVLKQQAKLHHRSLQGELKYIIEAAANKGDYHNNHPYY